MGEAAPVVAAGCAASAASGDPLFEIERAEPQGRQEKAPEGRVRRESLPNWCDGERSVWPGSPRESDGVELLDRKPRGREPAQDSVPTKGAHRPTERVRLIQVVGSGGEHHARWKLHNRLGWGGDRICGCRPQVHSPGPCRGTYAGGPPPAARDKGCLEVGRRAPRLRNREPPCDADCEDEPGHKQRHDGRRRARGSDELRTGSGAHDQSYHAAAGVP